MKKTLPWAIIAVFIILTFIGFFEHDAIFKAMWNFLVVNEAPNLLTLLSLSVGAMMTKKGLITE